MRGCEAKGLPLSEGEEPPTVNRTRGGRRQLKLSDWLSLLDEYWPVWLAVI